MTVWYEGSQFDERTRDMLVEVDALTPFAWTPSQGSYSNASASAGTHSGGGAVDVTGLGVDQCNALVDAMRRVGFAAWHRTPEQSDWVRHVHGIAVQPGGKGDRGCLHPSAHDQVIDYYEGRNGLAGNGPDDGPRQYVGTTWEEYSRQDQDDEDEMAGSTVVFFRTTGAWYASYPHSGTYRIMKDNQTVEDVKTVVTRAGGKWSIHSDQPVQNIDAFGVRLDD